MLRLFWSDLDEVNVEIRDMKWFWEHRIHNINYMWQGSDLNLGLVIKDNDKVIYSRPPVAGMPRSYCDPEADYEARVNALETDEQIYIKSILQELRYRKDAYIRRIVLNY